MYHDLIAYCSDTAALVAELQTKLPHRVLIEDGSARYLVPKTQTVRNGSETLALIRLTEDERQELLDAELSTLTILGSFEDVLADEDKLAIYDRIYPRAPVTVDGVTFTPPPLIGAFA